jgi:hypothetical protein
MLVTTNSFMHRPSDVYPASGQGLILSLVRNGLELPPEDIKKVFDAFSARFCAVSSEVFDFCWLVLGNPAAARKVGHVDLGRVFVCITPSVRGGLVRNIFLHQVEHRFVLSLLGSSPNSEQWMRA